MAKTRKQIEFELNKMGGQLKNLGNIKWNKLANDFNDIVVKENVKKYGVKSLNPYDPSDARYIARKRKHRN